jgi:glycosyltransferase involved in cell wall biosynthesis/GT2 family glycosyltransferase
MKSGATETAYVYLSEHYQFPDNVFVSHLPEEIKKSNHSYKILWAHHAYDQPVFVNFDHNTVNHIVSPSQWNKEQLIRYHNIPEHKISVIPNGVADIFSYSDKKTKTMIYTSIPYKGLEVLARIIPKIHQVHPDAKFKIFSSMSLYGPSNDQFINIYDHLKTLPYVEYSAAVDQVELVPHYQEAAFFIHPNIWEETFCVSMVEAMKSGAYPIITNIGALAEVAGENNASVVPIDGTPTSKGYQVTEDFMNSFADACCLALDYYDKEQEYYHKVSKIISDGVSEKYNWKKIAEQWETLISNIQKNQIDTPPVYYCMVSTHNSEEYTDLAINSFFRNTQFREQDKFFLIDNDGKYQLTQNRDKITIISNHQPKSFAENMNFIMKLAFIDKSDFLGLSNDLFFTENWNKNFGTRKSISVPLCNQKLTGEFGDLKIKSAMNIDDFGEKETELNEFVKTIDPQKLNNDKQILGFYCFHIPYEVLSKVGFFDEKFVNGAEDIDYRLRAYDLGFDMDVNYSSYLLHFYGKSTWRSGETKDSTLTREKNYRKYFEKKWGKSVADQLLAKSSVT